MTSTDIITGVGVAVAYLGLGAGAFFHLDNKIDTKFDVLDKKIETLDKKIDTKFDVLDKKIDTKFDVLDKKIDTGASEVRQMLTQLLAMQENMNGQLIVLSRMAHEHSESVRA